MRRADELGISNLRNSDHDPRTAPEMGRRRLGALRYPVATRARRERDAELDFQTTDGAEPMTTATIQALEGPAPGFELRANGDRLCLFADQAPAPRIVEAQAIVDALNQFIEANPTFPYILQPTGVSFAEAYRDQLADALRTLSGVQFG